MTLVRIEEPARQATIELLHAYAKKKGRVDVHPSALKRLVRHATALDRGTAFPGKGVRFLDWLAQESAGKPAGADAEAAPARTFYPRDISEAYSRFSGVPLALLSDDVAADAHALAALLQARVIGQDAACAACGRMLARFKANMVDPDRPSGSLLFVGPTGVGKTELAKQIARTTFGSEDRMVRVDMSEYRLGGAAARLLDARSGARSLAVRVREQPLCLVLLDEIEKAHPEVFDLLLGVLGEGRLLDSTGRLVDFRGATIVMTSNLGVRDTRSVGFGDAASDDHLRAVRAHFRPELFNRIDYVLPFRSLDVADVERIVDLEIAGARSRLGLVRRGVRLEASPRARRRLAELGHHPTRGARPLKRLFEERVLTPVARRIAEDPAFRDRRAVVLAEGEAPSGADADALVVTI
jgi:ATP-dependent Clp protease ATP-binding subunit ClpC